MLTQSLAQLSVSVGSDWPHIILCHDTISSYQSAATCEVIKPYTCRESRKQSIANIQTF